MPATGVMGRGIQNHEIWYSTWKISQENFGEKLNSAWILSKLGIHVPKTVLLLLVPLAISFMRVNSILKKKNGKKLPNMLEFYY